MLFIVFGYDDPEKSHLRYENYELHKRHISGAKEFGVNILVGGPLVKEDDSEAMIGSFLLAEAEDKSTIEKLFSADPFKRLQLWKEIRIERFEHRSGSADLKTK
jgi:uncharacterized protein